jgi:hypothetical protein
MSKGTFVMTEIQFNIVPPGLPGMNRLALRLNELQAAARIGTWHLGRWGDRAKTRHGIQFESDEDAGVAKLEMAYDLN